MDKIANIHKVSSVVGSWADVTIVQSRPKLAYINTYGALGVEYSKTNLPFHEHNNSKPPMPPAQISPALMAIPRWIYSLIVCINRSNRTRADDWKRAVRIVAELYNNEDLKAQWSTILTLDPDYIKLINPTAKDLDLPYQLKKDLRKAKIKTL